MWLVPNAVEPAQAGRGRRVTGRAGHRRAPGRVRGGRGGGPAGRPPALRPPPAGLRWRPSSCSASWRSTWCSPRSSGSTRASTASTTPSGTGSWSRSASTSPRSPPTWRCSAGILGGRSETEVRAPPRRQGLVPDHHGRAGGHAPLLGRRRRRHRAHLLGAAQGGHAAAPVGLPDGRLPGAHLLGLPGGAGDLRRAAAHRRAARRQPGGRHDRARGHRRRRGAAARPGRPDPRRLRAAPQAVTGDSRMGAAGGQAGHRAGHAGHAACAPRSTTSPTPAAARSPWAARWASGPRRSACCGPASRRSAATCRSRCSCRASSWAWPPT